MDLDSIVKGAANIWNRLQGLAETCGANAKEARHQEAGLAHVFSLHPLAEAEPEAVRATQRGARLLHEGRVEESIRELHDARNLAPRSHVVCCNLGCAYQASKDDNAALYWYREAQRLAPQDETAILALSLLEQRRGQVDEAQRLLKNFLSEVDSAHVGAIRQLGRLHQREGHWSQAAGCFHRLIAIDPTNNEWPAQLQACLDQLPVKDGLGQEFGRAISFAEPIMRGAAPINQNEAMALSQNSRGGYGRGPGDLSATSTTCSSWNGQMQGGGSSFRNTGPGQSFAPIQESYGSGNAAVVQISEARRQRENGRADAALGIYRGLLRADPRNVEALLGFADCHQDLGNFDDALEAVKQVLASKPDDPEANLRVAELLIDAGYEVSMVDPYLKRASQGDLGRSSAGGSGLRQRLLCVETEAALGKEDNVKALSSASEAVRMDASSARSLVLLATARLRVADYQAALRAVSAALEAGGAGSTERTRRLHATAHTVAAQAHERNREYPQAIARANQALDQVSDLLLARVTKALAMHQSGRSREAEEELMALLQRHPQYAPARLQLAYFQLASGDSSRAAAILEALLAGQSSIPRSQLGTAKVYLALALEDQPDRQHRAQSLAKESLSLHRNLQTVWKEIDSGKYGSQPVEAVQRLRGICDLDLTSSQARQLLQLLAGATGRQDLVRGLAPGGTPMGSFRHDAGSNRRDSSVPPARWAPGGAGGARSGTSTPNGYAQAGSFATAGMPLGSQQARMRGGESFAPFGSGAASGWQSPNPQGARGARSREQSRERGNALTIGWNELIKPEQLTFGPQLGAGGSAAVFRGSWNGQEVAIKKISGVAHLEEMKKEIDALRRLRHPRLVRFIGACVQPPLLLVVTEFMAGGSLHDRIFGRGRSMPLPPQARWTIASHTAEGLGFLHSQRVVHRDLKSMNILLDAQQNAKICDFGLAHQMCMESTHIARKLDGEGGSPRYMAPECYDAAHGKLTEKVDIWAMGCILIELFGGVLPYADCQTMAQLSARILVEKRPPDAPPGVPAPIIALLHRCVVFDPGWRLTADDLQRELSRMRQ
mmetsp:Transcript_77524/g.136749  ORF Transcript_77524/g.136749 Transcript_77524/m.136749 type:complete len:1064 (+) Transcript_77524:137-3328(+)|eukprot:CAMPEP_0197653730 /NCGR_PEP_ID=MMETSP1338-20131121/36867_1 /TAXON_ID=43686 ORGANISM="Pelagodinium beii, Strain RCC1491" /NCGR_SAMPLE_ID=MMETSP1338 /ASSEMBLY_ACC=CAM_ASM_000754 /LENGTH=1063 /DNA_ID=CAMNT_0043228951 /DNA_START=124 /DNA_END=3315 /DNA_ORIENTATION=+